MTKKDVEKLRELVKTRPAEKPSHPGHSRVGLLSPHGSRALLSILTHRTELIENENAAILSGSRLAKENRARRLNLDGEGHEDHKGKSHDQSHRCQSHVEKSLDDFGACSLNEAVREDEPTGSQLGHQNFAGSLFVEGRPILDDDATETAFEQGIGGEVPPTVLLNHHYHVRTRLLDDRGKVGDLP